MQRSIVLTLIVVICLLGISGVLVLVTSAPLPLAPFAVPGQTLEPDVNPNANVLTERGAQVTVMTWNIAFGYGLGANSEDAPPRPEADQAQRLAAIASFLKNNGPDVLLLQEVDFHAKRSHLVDQYSYLMREAGYSYGARVVNWSKRFIPWPLLRYWQWIGPMASGGAVLSRYPICGHRAYEHPLPIANNFLYNMYYMNPYTQLVRICAGNESFFVLNSHFDTGSKIEREREARALERIVIEGRAAAAVALVGGDFSSIPPEDPLQVVASENAREGYRGDKTVAIVRAVPRLKDVFTKLTTHPTPELLRTYPVDRPDARLDYLFIDEAIAVSGVDVVRMTGTMSDHFPVRATLRW